MSSNVKVKKILFISFSLVSTLFGTWAVLILTTKNGIFIGKQSYIEYLFEQLPILMIFLTTIFFAFKSIQYLNNDKKNNNSSKSDELSNIIKSEITHQIKNKINLKENIITPEEKQELLKTLKLKIVNENTENYLKDIEQKVTIKTAHDEISSLMKITLERINTEIRSLVRRSNYNLVIGMGLSFWGIMALFYFFFQETKAYIIMDNTLTIAPPPKNLEELLMRILPKAMFVVMIELFSYFFLNLYKKSLNEIKYYQNELTNIESKFLALKSAKQLNNHKLMSIIIEELVKTERNFILEPGHSTIEIEKEKISSTNSSNVIKAATELLNFKK
ncbi:hypothetical protein [Acinetobacter pittii]|uniref:hypothetical protein n=1 Tax=Acinetobacter pittii TaxID=48296 RepID=UPI001023A656|nr:hypothetical protein [Acinetobacter pittii]RZG83478.1 hypothetical protein EXE06_08305 [Acinetobacter pittii]RZH54658.1 hypothetical protein EXD88_11515 [Acinetobacter pittii]RZH60119.1 hypothetical protein EXD90_09485 [Acinetobacter pittii]